MQSKSECNEPNYRCLVIIFFVSLDKEEFTQCAKELACKVTYKKDCFYISWLLAIGKTFKSMPESNKMVLFMRQHCEGNNWDMTEWLKIQSKSLNYNL